MGEAACAKAIRDAEVAAKVRRSPLVGEIAQAVTVLVAGDKVTPDQIQQLYDLDDEYLADEMRDEAYVAEVKKILDV